MFAQQLTVDLRSYPEAIGAIWDIPLMTLAKPEKVERRIRRASEFRGRKLKMKIFN